MMIKEFLLRNFKKHYRLLKNGLVKLVILLTLLRK